MLYAGHAQTFLNKSTGIPKSKKLWLLCSMIRFDLGLRLYLCWLKFMIFFQKRVYQVYYMYLLKLRVRLIDKTIKFYVTLNYQNDRSFQSKSINKSSKYFVFCPSTINAVVVSSSQNADDNHCCIAQYII